VRRVCESLLRAVKQGKEAIPRGRSYKSSVDFYPQTWWCLVPTFGYALDATDDYEGLMQGSDDLAPALGNGAAAARP
jgi:hypothetical protein